MSVKISYMKMLNCLPSHKSTSEWWLPSNIASGFAGRTDLSPKLNQSMRKGRQLFNDFHVGAANLYIIEWRNT